MICKSNFLAVVTMAAVGISPAVLAQEGPPKATSEVEKTVGEAGIRELIAALGAEEHASRKQAERALIEMGDAARKPLAEAVEEHDDPEVRWRARRVLRVLDGEQPRLERRGGEPGEAGPGRAPRAGQGDVDVRMEQMMRRLERAFGEDFGRLRGFEDMQRQLDEMRRQFDELGRRAGPGMPRAWVQGVPGAAGQGVKIQMGPDGVRVEVQETDADGEATTKTYEAESLEEFRAEHPEVALRYLHDGGGGGPFGWFDFGRSQFEDTDGDGLPDARLPGLRPFQDSDGDGLPDRRTPGFQPLPLEGFEQFDVVPAPAAPPAEGERLGVYLGDLAPAVRDFLGLERGQGLLVESLEEGSLAADLGIRPRDVVVEIGGEAVGDPADVRAALRAIDKDAEVVVRVNRMGETLTLKAVKRHAAPAEAGKLRKRQPAEAEAPGRGR